MRVRLDDLDIQILSLITKSRNGEINKRELARKLNVSEGTIRNRLGRLIERKVLCIKAVIDPFSVGYDVDAMIGVNTSPGLSMKVAEEIAKLPQVRYVGLASGTYDLIVTASFRSNDDLVECLMELGRVQGVQRTETMHVLRVVKRAVDWEPDLQLAEKRPAIGRIAFSTSSNNSSKKFL